MSSPAKLPTPAPCASGAPWIRTRSPISSDNLRKRNLKADLARAGLPAITLHDLRHTFASIMLHEWRVPPAAVSKMMGHASISFTLDVYGHLIPSATADEIRRLARRRLGLEGRPAGRHVEEHAGDEVFDYARRCLLYVEEGIGEPTLGIAYAEACARRAEELVGISGGRALIPLSTSRAVRAFRETFDVPHPVRFQGDDAPGRLVRWLKGTEGAVLVGTRTFWEGVDVPGDSVSLVVMDRAPFPPPNDPVVAKLCEKAGKGWFREVSLPKAQVALRQGAGRLMRRSDDRGVIAFLDPRIRARGWGQSVIKALPPAPVTGSVEEVRRFFASDTPGET